jgi:hypothetical protein
MRDAISIFSTGTSLRHSTISDNRPTVLLPQKLRKYHPGISIVDPSAGNGRWVNQSLIFSSGEGFASTLLDTVILAINRRHFNAIFHAIVIVIYSDFRYMWHGRILPQGSMALGYTLTSNRSKVGWANRYLDLRQSGGCFK